MLAWFVRLCLHLSIKVSLCEVLNKSRDRHSYKLRYNPLFRQVLLEVIHGGFLLVDDVTLEIPIEVDSSSKVDSYLGLSFPWI